MSARKCICCGADSYVLDTRELLNGDIRRRRKCQKCGKRWNTIETLEWTMGKANENERIS